MIPLSTEGTTPNNEASIESNDRELTPEETVMQWVIVVLVPALITFIAFGIIVLAYGQWKLY